MSSAMDGQESRKGHDFQASLLKIMQDQRSFMEQQTTYLRQMSEQFSQVLSSGTPSLPSPASNPFFPDTSSSVASPPIPQQLDTPTVSPEVRKKAKKAHAATKPHSVLRRQWDDDLGWSAVLQTALKRIHEQVESWKDSLDTTLLFIALFSAIVTAFLLPTLSALVPAPGQNTDLLLQNLVDLVTQIASLNGLRTPNIDPPPAFEAATSDEISAALWYSSLIVNSMCRPVDICTLPDA
ncbi:hypothetical protein SISNIDRAFT_164233 [Sistotremastrum niveocremeum HHB9708]|uniref:DUF6535 domain-containing protein n=1 Tax=Sistotremastrum niveocremeum HHB9708 TaxID=1314777 RepID=A0A164SF97_9AGAM|nr:hypothetical protein SISNIDRAFT_164233 [Sistotremastrum niveocremeum HHB9708]